MVLVLSHLREVSSSISIHALRRIFFLFISKLHVIKYCRLADLIALFVSFLSCGYTHLGFGAFRTVIGFGLVQLRFHVTLGDAITQ